MTTRFQTINNRSQVHEFFRNLERLGKQGFKIDDLSRFPIEVTEIITGNTIHYVVIEPRR